MNWKRGLTRIYAVLWAIIALGGAVVAISATSTSMDDPTAIWGAWLLWVGVCLVVPAGLFWLIKWVAAGFGRGDTTKTPSPQRAPASPPLPATPTGGPKKQSRFRQGLWPEISDVDSAKKAAHLGASASFWVAGLTAVFAVLGIFKVVKLLDGWGLVDAAAFAVIGFFIMKRMSRGAAVAGLVFYIFERVYATATKGASAGLGGVALVFTLYFINGVRGTFAYRRFREPPSDDLTTAKAA